MNLKLTVQSLIDAGIPMRAGNLCPEDPRFYQYINSFQERALQYGRWWGTTALMDFCVTNDGACSQGGACIVMPREVAVIEALTLNNVPMQPRNAWYSYVNVVAPPAGGCGNNASACQIPLYPWGRNFKYGPWNISEDKLTVPCFQFTTTGQAIRFYFNPADLGKKIIVQGRDENNVWVRTEIDGVVQDGEQVTLAQTDSQYYIDTTTSWYVGNPLGIIKEVTNYAVSMFAVDPDTGDAAQQLANYEPTETHPSYRKFYLPGPVCGCGGATNATLRCIVSLQHVPVSQPNDWLLFQNTPVYLDGIKSELLRDNNDLMGADRLFFGADDTSRNGRGVLRAVKLGGALPTLQAELRKNTADLTTIQVRRSGVSLQGFV